ncbi:DUF3953 domain-containing protein [Niallia circulans]|uniref:DUF3953 domain-containing protein n=1 Tax=Niallia circulans TaxID=1397 RepID=A0A553SS45_NIACI|nr:YczI family protein [Niallia circulans]TRZ39817.1 DUF3953 domain-containing protein [Niallia circulans]
MVSILRIIFSLSAASLAIYGLITDNTDLMPLTFGFLGLTFIIMGISEWKKTNKGKTALLFATACFVLYVSISSSLY